MIDVQLPSLGPEMTSGKLLEWRIVPGQQVRKGTVIAVVDTEKAAIDVESWHDGEVVELLATPGQDLAVGTVIARLATPGEARLTLPASVPRSVPTPSAPPSAAPVAATVRALPAARARAAELGVALEGRRGRGPGGAITLQDVEDWATEHAPRAADAAAGGDRPDSVRRAIAASMARSKREIPHYYLWDEIDVAAALGRLRLFNAARSVTGRVLPVAMLLTAVARAAGEFTDMNGAHDGLHYRPSGRVNLGVAVALRSGGLIAPALIDAHLLSVGQLMQGLSDLVRRARAGGLRSSEVTGQTITVTALGDEGSRGLLGVIYPPQVALVGIGRISLRPVVESGVVVPRECVTISLAADHRVSDGRRGAQFLARIAALLQSPELLEGT